MWLCFSIACGSTCWLLNEVAGEQTHLSLKNRLDSQSRPVSALCSQTSEALGSQI